MESAPARPPGKYPIRVVARLTGIPIDTLRAWERRYGAVEPGRDDRGRLYDDVDLQKLKLLRRLVERGHAIGRIANLGEPELGRLLEAGLEPHDRGGKADAVDLEGLLEAVDRYDLPAVDRKLGRLSAVLTSREMVHEVVLPFMREVGKGWQEGRYTVAQEHMVSASLRNLLGSLVRLQAPRDGRPGLVFATPPGERHELGITAAAMLAAAGGLGVVYLGSDLPTSDVVEAVRRTGARAVVMALTRLELGPSSVEAVRAVVEGVPGGVEVYVGGAAAEARPDEVRHAGATVLPTFEALEHAYRALGGRF
ncbi:MAG: methyltransferase cognate corrinoid protein, Methanosarcina family [Anaeromyxobacteraceae bacterium]|nr:methyltransferase cognate corrinoid protein, Methanosarcina family [Anaeromyxobacteraceae bacterium]